MKGSNCRPSLERVEGGPVGTPRQLINSPGRLGAVFFILLSPLLDLENENVLLCR